jgi:hypothetical protein
VPQDLHEEPRRVAAGAAAEGERLVRRLHAVLQPDDVAHRAVDAQVEGDEEIDRRARREVDACFRNASNAACGGVLPQERRQLHGQLLLVGEGDLLGRRVQEKVKGVQDGHLGDQVHLDREHPGRLREDQPRAVVALRILLPVDEVLRGLDLERIAQDGGPAMGGRLEPDRLRPEHDARSGRSGRMSCGDGGRHP